ncbi:MAG: hypothetical protein ACYSUJ_01640 [Planctomycetota bacterium]|jgi:hypothetical protein
MKRIQKIAWFFVVTITVSIVLTLIAISILYAKYGFPKAIAGFSTMGLVGVAGFSPLIFKKDKGKVIFDDKGKVIFDERDRIIKRRAALAGFGMSYLVVGLACMIPFSVLGPKASISVSWLPNIFGAAAITMFYIHSLAILVQYGWREKGESHE